MYSILKYTWVRLLVCLASSGAALTALTAEARGAEDAGAHYAFLFGRHYRTKVDLYLFALAADPEIKYVGVNDGRDQPGTRFLPSGVKREAIGRARGSIALLDVVPAGSELIVRAETHEVTSLSGIHEAGGYPMGFIAELNYGGGKHEAAARTEFIQSHVSMAEAKPNQRLDEALVLDETAAFAPPTDLVATLADPINIDLTWKNQATAAAGYCVEYKPSETDEFTHITTVGPHVTHYRHPNLIPHTRFIFRVRPYFGEASDAVEITTGKDGPQQPPSEDPTLLKTKNQKKIDAAKDRVSLRSLATLMRAAPANFTAKLIPPAGVQMAWTDRARDADGYFVEIKSAGEAEFIPSAFLDPGTSSLVSYGFPFESKFFLRVRAIFYGSPSNTAEQTTGADPADEPDANAAKPRKSE